MNTSLLQGKMRENGDTIESLSSYLGISVSALNNKISKKTEFKRNEIMMIATRYSLSSEKMASIFFENLVSNKEH